MSGGGSKTTTQQELAPEQRDILNAVMPAIMKAAKSPTPIYPGQRVAGFTPAEKQAQTQVTQAAGGPMQDIASSAAGASDFLTSGAVLDPRANPGLAGAIQAGIDPLKQQYESTVMPQIRSDAILSGQYGGSEQAQAERLASSDFERNVAGATANIVNPAYQAGLDAYTRGLALAPQTAGLQLSPAQALAGVGADQRAMQQAQIDSDTQKWMEQHYGDLLKAEEIASIAFGMPMGKGVTQASGGGTNPLMGGLGGAASGAALGTMVMPGVGTGVGAGLGALLGFLGSG